MSLTQTFSSRKEKEVFLREIIKKLSISESEKELYILCLDVLDTASFEEFFQKIISQIESNENRENFITIEPLSPQLL